MHEPIGKQDQYIAAYGGKDFGNRAGLWRLFEAFDRLRREDDWHHSAWNRRAVVQRSASKVHMAVNYTRYRSDGSVIGHYDSLYVMVLKDGRWGTQIRSSFGP